MKKKPSKRSRQSAHSAVSKNRRRNRKARDRQGQLATVAHVISKMRTEAVSLRRASLEFGIDPRTVLRLAESALFKSPTGRYVAKDRDRISRLLLIPTPDGLREITLSDSRQASRLGKYWDAVQKYLETGDSFALRAFEGKYLKGVKGERIPLLTDLDELDRLGSAGVLSFESVYARTA